IWRGLAVYFDATSRDEAGAADRRAIAGQMHSELMDHMFKREGWGADDATASGRLLKLARELVSMKFGGALLTYTGIEGIALQTNKALLTRWLVGKEITYSVNFSANKFYAQVRALLKGLGVEDRKNDQLIVDAVFEERGWADAAATATAGERLLLEARRRVALKFGGVLPQDTGIEGVAGGQDNRGPLARWLARKDVVYSYTLSAKVLYTQVSALLKGLGVEDKKIDRLIIAAVFEERGWTDAAATAGERLLLAARRFVALKFGGVLPQDTGIEGVASGQDNRGPLARWLAGKEITYSINLSAKYFYAQMRALLKGLGVKDKKIGRLIAAAVFEERGWANAAATAGERLLLEARRRVALKFGGVLPANTGIDGVAQQSDRRPLTLWLTGKGIAYSSKLTETILYAQVRALLKGLGADDERIDQLIEAAVFEERGWTDAAATAAEWLLLETRRRVALKFGGALPNDAGIEGVSRQSRNKAALTRWLSGKDVELSENLRRQIRALLTHENHITPAVADLLISQAAAASRGR
ncbi:MAG: hypothetical protein V2A66_00620, partial [Pseudomonadota bacterium]